MPLTTAEQQAIANTFGTFENFSQIAATAFYGTTVTIEAAKLKGNTASFATYPETLSPYFGQAVAERFFTQYTAMLNGGDILPSEPIHLSELGPGSGRLAYDVLHYIQSKAESSTAKDHSKRQLLYQNLQYDLFDFSLRLQSKQRAALKPLTSSFYTGKVNFILWNPQTPPPTLSSKKRLWIINEVFDDLPHEKLRYQAGNDNFDVACPVHRVRIDSTLSDKLRTQASNNRRLLEKTTLKELQSNEIFLTTTQLLEYLAKHPTVSYQTEEVWLDIDSIRADLAEAPTIKESLKHWKLLLNDHFHIKTELSPERNPGTLELHEDQRPVVFYSGYTSFKETWQALNKITSSGFFLVLDYSFLRISEIFDALKEKKKQLRIFGNEASQQANNPYKQIGKVNIAFMVSPKTR